MTEATATADVGAERGSDPIEAAVAPGYAFEGTALELGGLMTGPDRLTATRIRIPLSMLNRHGLVAGATGTGKTKTLQLLAEQLSAAGVPVFAADIKGDLSGLATPGEGGEKITARAASVGQEWQATGFPVEYYAIGGEGIGIPVRVTISSFGPTLLARVLGLNDTQESSLATGLPLRRQGRAPAARPGRPACGRPAPDQRRGQARAEGARRSVAPRPPG